MKPVRANADIAFLAGWLSLVLASMPELSMAQFQSVAPSRTASSNAQNLAGGPVPISTAEDLSTAFRRVAESMRASVVSISTVQVVEIRRSRDLFGRRLPAIRQEQEGEGSGVIIRPNGVILTNNHVIEDADEVTVEMFDGRVIKAEIVGTDPATDLAVLKIPVDNLRAAPIGNSDATRVGDWVLAIGSPFGLDQTVTAGIISGKNRVQQIINDGNGFEDFLQTDAAINPGNSGGPLVNLQGELIGINTAIVSKSGASAGIGFAIPVAMAVPVLDSILEFGQVRRGFLGAQVESINPKLANRFDLKVNQGGLVQRVLDGQPAALAGLQAGDVVTRVDGRPVIGGPQFRNAIASKRPGETIQLDVNRNGSRLSIPVSLEERTAERMAQFNPALRKFGARMQLTNERLNREYGLPSRTSGLIITGIEAGKEADEYGLQVGDVIIGLNDYPFESLEEFGKVLFDADRQGIRLPLKIQRGDQLYQFVPQG
ncbi:MAG: Do family serine endopeptidase [Planctomycetota bacterium]